MLASASKRLVDDHGAIDEALQQLQAALSNGDVAASHARLDLFWAKLAVHIRAEHLHLFPAVLKHANEDSLVTPIAKPHAVEASWAIGRLRADHEFMMHELAQLIQSMRNLAGVTDSLKMARELSAIRDVIVELEKRLVIHNEFEESQIYRWASTIIDEQEQKDLADRIDLELANRPPRFSADDWGEK